MARTQHSSRIGAGFIGVGLAFLALALGRIAFLGVGIAFLSLGIVFVARARTGGTTGSVIVPG